MFAISAYPPMRICVLEDSYTLSREICRILGESGHDVDHFSVPEEALYAILKKDYDILLLSQYEPRGGLDCPGLLRTLRMAADPDKRQVPRVVLTTDPRPENLRSLSLAGATRVIVRRNGTELEEQIQHALRTGIGTPPPASEPRSETPAGPSAAREPIAAPAPPPELRTQVRAAPPPITPTPPLAPKAAETPRTDTNPASRLNSDTPLRVRRPQWLGALRSRGTRRFFYIVPLAILAIVELIVLFVDEAVPVEAVTVQPGTLYKSVNGLGRVVSKKEVDLTAVIPGQITKVFVEEGAMVKKGKVLAALDDREASINVKRAEAQLLVAEEEAGFLERSYTQLMAESQKSDVPEDKIEKTRTALNAAKAKRQLATEELRAARLSRDRLKIEAPFDGMVLRSFAIEGLWAQQPTALFTLIDTAQREASIVVEGEDARDVGIGQTVKMSSDAFPALQWNGNIDRVIPNTSTGKGLGRINSVTVYATLGPDAPPLRYGQVIDAQIVTESRPNTIKLPFEAVLSRGGRNIVALVDDEQVAYKPVEIGLQALTEIEIVNGVELGQHVILPRRALEEGQKVEVSLVGGYEAEDVEGFPLRTKFANVQIYSTEQLRKNFDAVVIVDVRSKFEFDVVHVSQAINIPVSAQNFTKQLLELRPRDSTKPIIFYCNGHSCPKSYEATRIAAADGFKHIYAYDSGIFDWMRSSRDRTTLLSTTPAPVSKMVSEDYFQSRLIDFDAFKKKANDGDALVIDIRDEMQRKTSMTLPTLELPLDKFITELNAGRFKDKQLLIFDAVGKQVRWLQYILEDRGYKDYFFLRRGMSAVSS